MTAYTLSNLAFANYLEDFWSLYNSTCEIYGQEIGKNTILTLDTEYCDKAVKTPLAELFSDFFHSHAELFLPDKKQIPIKHSALKYFSCFDSSSVNVFKRLAASDLEWEKNHSNVDTTFCYHKFEGLQLIHEIVITFDSFIQQYIKVICSAIYNESKISDPSISPFNIIAAVESHGSRFFQGKKEQCIVHEETHVNPTDAPLYLYDALIYTSCSQEKHIVRPSIYYAKQKAGDCLIALPVHYCEDCKKYLIGKQTLSLFEACFGKFIIQIKRNFLGNGCSWDSFGESKLHELGYNVVEGKMTDFQRQELLVSIIQGKIMTYFEVSATIEQNIRLFESQVRMEKAVSKWRRDLKFLGEYIINK